MLLRGYVSVGWIKQLSCTWKSRQRDNEAGKVPLAVTRGHAHDRVQDDSGHAERGGGGSEELGGLFPSKNNSPSPHGASALRVRPRGG